MHNAGPARPVHTLYVGRIFSLNRHPSCNQHDAWDHRFRNNVSLLYEHEHKFVASRRQTAANYYSQTIFKPDRYFYMNGTTLRMGAQRLNYGLRETSQVRLIKRRRFLVVTAVTTWSSALDLTDGLLVFFYPSVLGAQALLLYRFEDMGGISTVQYSAVRTAYVTGIRRPRNTRHNPRYS